MSNEQNKIEKLKQNLYSRDSKMFDVNRRHRLRTEAINSPQVWVDEKGVPALEDIEQPNFTNDETLMTSSSKKTSFAFKFLLIAFIFFVIAVGFAGYRYFSSTNIVSATNVNLAISGPISIAAGDILSYGIEIKNENSVPLTGLSYLVEYPDGARRADDLTKELIREGQSNKTLAAGASMPLNFKSVLFGAEGDKKDLKFTVEYRMPGSNAVFHTSKTYTIEISSAPISVTVTGLKEVTSGQTINFTVEVRSDSAKVIQGLLLKTEFPFGFSLKKSEHALGSNMWSVGDLAPGAKRSLSFTGVLEGQDSEERVFKFTTGLVSPKDSMIIGTPFFTSVASVAIQKPFLGVKIALDGGDASKYTAKPGKMVKVDLMYQNNLSTIINNAELVVRLSGQALNRNTINVEQGYYNSSEDVITFNREGVENLAALAPGATGNLSFSFSTFPSSVLTSGNSGINIEVTARGLRGEGKNVSQEILYSSIAKVQVGTEVKLSAQDSYVTGPFTNSGSIPPKANKPTTYTITWSLINTLNDATGVSVTGTMPSYVTWLNVISPTEENVTYDAVTGEVAWSVGDLKGGVGKGSSPRTVSFQVSYTPSISQIGERPVIMTESSVVGTDKFTNSQITATAKEINTNLNGDGQFDFIKSVVAQ
ncbi:MAG: hypothetical protein WCO30_00315 [bacterium]